MHDTNHKTGYTANPLIALSRTVSHVFYYIGLFPTVVLRRIRGSRYLKRHPHIRTTIDPADPFWIINELNRSKAGLELQAYTIDVKAYNRWVSDARYPPLLYHVAKREKYLEHFVSYDLLGLHRMATILDVASFRSYFPNIMRAKGYRVIVQDLVFRPGLNGDVLGGNASSMELPSSSIDAMTLHCSFEHFEGDSDIAFMRESARILKPGGRVVILPLYLHQEYLTQADPCFLATDNVLIDAGADLVAVRGYANRHGRHYSPAAFLNRVHRAAVESGLHPVLKVVENAKEVSQDCYLKFALVLDKVRDARAK